MRVGGARARWAIGRAEREVSISVIISVITSALRYLISSPPAQTWQQKKKKEKKRKRKENIPRNSNTSHLLIPHHLALTSQIVQFSFRSSLALLCTLISCEKDFHRRLVVVRSRGGISIRYWLSCTMFRMHMCASAIADVSERQVHRR